MIIVIIIIITIFNFFPNNDMIISQLSIPIFFNFSRKFSAWKMDGSISDWRRK